MASAKLFGCTINVEAEEECSVGGDGVDGSTTSVEVSPSGFQPVVEVTSLSFSFSPFNQREIGASNPYLPFAEWSSDSGSVSMDSVTDPHSSFIDFFDRESFEVDTVESFHLSPNQMISNSADSDIWGFHEMQEDIDLGLGIGSGSGSGSGSGHLTVDLDWEGFQPTVIDMGSHNGNRDSDSGGVEIGTGLGGAMMADEELEWENLQNAINWVEEPVHVSVFRVEEEAEEEEFSLASRDDEHDLDWQVLLAVDNAVDFFQDSEADDIMVDAGEMDFSFYLASIEEYGGNHGDYDAIFGQMFDNNEEAGIIGSPPASKSVVDKLPAVKITSAELNNGNIVCAICKDEIVVEEKVKKLPCRHYYHGECIIPWLGIRNTCPVCRYELPTDDLEYERNRRSQRRGSSGLEMDFMSE